MENIYGVNVEIEGELEAGKKYEAKFCHKGTGEELVFDTDLNYLVDPSVYGGFESDRREMFAWLRVIITHPNKLDQHLKDVEVYLYSEQDLLNKQVEEPEDES
jgi:hypothetical protein